MARVRLPQPEPRACAQCGRIFTPPSPKKRRQRYCSLDCQRTMFRRAGNAPEPRAIVAAKAGDRLRGAAAEQHHYVKRDGRHEHRVVMEKKLGRPLVRGEVVHHIDHDKSNNDPDNLELLTSQSERIAEHRADLLAARRTEQNCVQCGEVFQTVPPFQTCRDDCQRGQDRVKVRQRRQRQKAGVQ